MLLMPRVHFIHVNLQTKYTFGELKIVSYVQVFLIPDIILVYMHKFYCTYSILNNKNLTEPLDHKCSELSVYQMSAEKVRLC